MPIHACLRWNNDDSEENVNLWSHGMYLNVTMKISSKKVSANIYTRMYRVYSMWIVRRNFVYVLDKGNVYSSWFQFDELVRFFFIKVLWEKKFLFGSKKWRNEKVSSTHSPYSQCHMNLKYSQKPSYELYCSSRYPYRFI